MDKCFFVLSTVLLSLIPSLLGLAIPTGSSSFRTDGDGLYHWRTGNLEVARSKSVEAGRDLILACTPPEDPWSHMDGCVWQNPQGQNWFVDRHQNQVVDENGAPVDGVDVWGDAVFGTTCGISIKGVVMDEGLMGDWSCELRMENFTLVGKISTEDVITTDLRLPGNAVPKNYKIDLIPDLHTNQPSFKNHKIHFMGNVSIRLEFTKATPVLKLHMDELTVTEIVVNAVDDPTRSFTVNKVAVDFQRTFIEIYLQEAQFEEGQVYDVLISFQADLVRPESAFNYGFYRMHHCNNGKACWFNLFAATYARNAFPCLDEPAMKSTFDMRVARKEGWTALSNMPLEKTEPMEGEEGWFWDKFFTSVVMSPYLVSLTVTDLVSLNSTVGNFSVWAPEIDVDSGRADYALEIAPKILRFYENYFGVKYPLPKMDLVSEKKKGTAMENWGLILFDPIYLLLDPENTDPDVKWDVTNTVAHEIAHQWFGNLVTMNWWSQTWLNEGFATFVSYLGAEEVDPKSNPWGRMLVDDIFRVMAADGKIYHHKAMSDEVIDRDAIENKFEKDYLYTYKKGGSVIRMMESILTRPTFTKGLTQYLTDLSYSTAVEEDLFMYLELSGHEDGVWPQGIDKSFGEVMKTWTDQAGLPVVNVGRSCMDNNCTLNLSQSWYISKGETDEERYWDIPISFTTAGGTNDDWNSTTPSLWLTAETSQIKSFPVPHLTPDIPVVVNVQAVGYYRVNYDQQNWRLIASTLNSNRTAIHHFNRAQIICDILHLEATGHVTTDTKNMVLEYIDKENDYTALKAHHNCARWVNNPSSTEENIVRI